MQAIDQTNLGVDAVFDALHGNIELSDFDKERAGQIRAIISAPFVQRLRRIKQLGFVSQNFLSAQHNRYSHALGTIHIMRKLINRVDQGSDLFNRALKGVQELTGDRSFSRSRASKSAARLKQHMLVAAAIQDVGELPYEKATAKIFTPGDRVRGTLGDAGVDLDQMTDKDAFTLSFVWNSAHAKEEFEGLDQVLLTYLVSGLVPKGRKASDDLQALRQMLDGTTIDADRLDYVYRDAFHTIGVHHTPDALIDSIVEYDHHGPALSHVRPVTDFIVTRAMLWSNVYLSPENRFRVILLRIALEALVDGKKGHMGRLIDWAPGAMTQENFLSVDDPFIDDLVEKAPKADLDLDQHASTALTLLKNGAAEYEYKWVAFAGKEQSAWSDRFKPPNEFYWDTYADYRERSHTLYTPASIRIVGDRYSLLDNVYLENCVGPFCRLLTPNLGANGGSDTWPALPMPEHMVWFVPRDLGDAPKRDPWRSLYEARSAAQLTTQLQLNDPLSGIDFHPDTRSLPDFVGPAIFLAFAWEDRDYVSRLAAILFQHNRRYFVFLQNFSAYGTSPVANSKKGVDEAEAVILLASVGYKKKWRNVVGPIYGEMLRMQARKDEIAIVPMGLDSEAELKEDFPWGHVTRDGAMPYLGPPLRGASTEDFRQAVMGVLKAIDGKKDSA